MKKDQYFNFEVNLLSDDNLSSMMLELDAAGSLGIFVILLQHLRTKDDYEASCQPRSLEVIARRYGLDLRLLNLVLFNYGLFEVNKERQVFRSPYLDRVMKCLEERWKKNAENGKKGGRPVKAKKVAQKPASKGEKPNETQEKRGEENKSITTVVSNSSNTTESGTPAAVAVVRSIDEEGQRPLQTVQSWESLVDQLPESQSYMEVACMHSGLGKLFIEHRERILQLFKEHIKLYSKGGNLLFLDDVKRYFSNYVAAGSITCRKLRAVLQTEAAEEHARDVSRFEERMNGERMYSGHVIPKDAPLRPDARSVWDYDRRVWTH